MPSSMSSNKDRSAQGREENSICAHASGRVCAKVVQGTLESCVREEEDGGGGHGQEIQLPRMSKQGINGRMEKSERIASFLLKSLRKANRAYGLIDDGDRIAVGVSGGKDSQTLVRLLARWQSCAPVQYNLVALHVDSTEIWEGAAEQRAALESLLRSLGVPYAVRPIELAADEPHPLSCFRCSWNRRRRLFTAARELGCNKVALGHHADDITETTLMNLLFHGRLESMAPKRPMFDGLITLIRPLALIEERDIVTYARSAGFLRESYCCPNGEISKRAEAKSLLRSAKKITPQAQRNLFRAVERASGWRDQET